MLLKMMQKKKVKGTKKVSLISTNKSEKTIFLFVKVEFI